MRRVPAITAAALALTACAAPDDTGDPVPVPPATTGPSAAPSAAVDGSRDAHESAARRVVLPAPASIARDRVERLAAICWLDDELAAEIMLVDRRTGAITATGPGGELLRVGLVPQGPLETEVTLSGPALADPGRAARMANALSRALEGPEPTC